MQRTLKRELKVLEIVDRETMVASGIGGTLLISSDVRTGGWVSSRSGVFPTHSPPPGAHGGVHSARAPVVVCPDEVPAEWRGAGGPTRRLSGTAQMSGYSDTYSGEARAWRCPAMPVGVGGGLHAVRRLPGRYRSGRPTFPPSTTKWPPPTRLETRTKESNVRASMRVIWKPECGAKAIHGWEVEKVSSWPPHHRPMWICPH